MILEDKLKDIKRQKRVGYIPYPIFIIILILSTYYWLNVLTITLGVIYIMAHQTHYYNKQMKLEEVIVAH